MRKNEVLTTNLFCIYCIVKKTTQNKTEKHCTVAAKGNLEKVSVSPWPLVEVLSNYVYTLYQNLFFWTEDKKA